MKHYTKTDKRYPKIDKPRASSLSSVLNIVVEGGDRFYFGGTKFKASNPWVKAAQASGWALFCAMSHRAKLSQRSRPDGWLTLPGKVAKLFGLPGGRKTRAVEKCEAAGLLLVQKGKRKTSVIRYRFACIKGPPLSSDHVRDHGPDHVKSDPAPS